LPGQHGPTIFSGSMDYEYIDTEDALERGVRRIAGAKLLGIDTEAAGYHRYHDRISLVQISTRDEHLLIDPIALNDLTSLAPVLSDPSIEKVFHDADFDLRILYRDLGLQVRSLFDTQIAAAFLGERLLGLGAIVEKYLGVSLPKAYQRADWAERPLNEGMKEYAVMDTAYLPALRDRLLEELTRIGRLEWAREEFVRREATRWTESDGVDDAFLRVKGARDLSPRGLAILREVHGWREQVGRERDQATFRVLSNQAMVEIGLKAPTTLAALRGISGVSGGLADRRGRDLIAAVKRGLAIPEGDLPRFPAARRWERDPALEERAEKLRKARNRLAESLDLDPGFLISRTLLEEVARRDPGSLEELREIPDMRAWQAEAVGEELVRALGH
jgi:ribonuclease D